MEKDGNLHYRGHVIEHTLFQVFFFIINRSNIRKTKQGGILICYIWLTAKCYIWLMDIFFGLDTRP